MSAESPPRIRIADSELQQVIERAETGYRWDTPREYKDWKFYRSQNTHYLSTTLQTFDHPRNTLILYRIVGRNEYKLLNTKLLNTKWSYRTKLMRQLLAERNSRALEAQNIEGLDVRWYTRLDAYQDRSGLKRFGTMPLRHFPRFWNRIFAPGELSMEGSFQIPTRLSIDCPGFSASRVTLSWPGVIASADVHHVTGSRYPALHWMRANCCGSIVPFSVRRSMFTEPIDDAHYTADFEMPWREEHG